MGREEALGVARRLVGEAVEVADKAGIDRSSVLAPHCPESAAKDNDVDDDGSNSLNWCDVPVRIDNSTDGLFEMPELDGDPEQKPAFLVTQATADLVRQDFERYKPSLERMVEDWQEEKSQLLREQANRKIAEKKSARRPAAPRRK